MKKDLSEKEIEESNRFQALPEEHKLRIANAANDQLFQITGAKLGTLPIIAGIAAALLVVATFNQELLPLSPLVRVLISILLLLVPVSLLAYVLFISRTERFGERLLMKIYGVPLRTGESWFIKLTHQLPWIVSLVISGIVLVAISIIWTQDGNRYENPRIHSDSFFTHEYSQHFRSGKTECRLK